MLAIINIAGSLDFFFHFIILIICWVNGSLRLPLIFSLSGLSTRLKNSAKWGQTARAMNNRCGLFACFEGGGDGAT